MGQIKKDIRKKVKKHGSKAAARIAAADWYDRGIKAMNEKGVQRVSRPTEPGKIYVFKYDPKHKEKLPWWDMSPIVLSLDSVELNDFGINLNLLPIMVKEELLDLVYDRFSSQIKNQSAGKRASNAKLQGELSLTWQGAKNFLKRFGYDFAVRQYIRNRKSDQGVVSYENWSNIILCDFANLNGTTYGKIKTEFRNSLKNK